MKVFKDRAIVLTIRCKLAFLTYQTASSLLSRQYRFTFCFQFQPPLVVTSHRRPLWAEHCAHHNYQSWINSWNIHIESIKYLSGEGWGEVGASNIHNAKVYSTPTLLLVKLIQNFKKHLLFTSLLCRIHCIVYSLCISFHSEILPMILTVVPITVRLDAPIILYQFCLKQLALNLHQRMENNHRLWEGMDVSWIS